MKTNYYRGYKIEKGIGKIGYLPSGYRTELLYNPKTKTIYTSGACLGKQEWKDCDYGDSIFCGYLEMPTDVMNMWYMRDEIIEMVEDELKMIEQGYRDE